MREWECENTVECDEWLMEYVSVDIASGSVRASSVVLSHSRGKWTEKTERGKKKK